MKVESKMKNESGYILAIPKPLLRRGWGGLFYHLGSTSMVTDYEGNVSQSVMYAPFGEVISEYKRGFDNDYITDYLFNGKELDEESGMYYFSARYYDPNGPFFISRDPLEEKYPGISPYAYCLNNPLKYVDPDGRDIELAFYRGAKGENSRDALTKTINAGLGGQFEAYYTKGANGGSLLNIRTTEGGGDFSKMSPEAVAFYTELYNMTADHSTTAQVDVKYGSSDVAIGNYKNNAIDIADINQFDDINKGGATKQGKLTHELVEQFGKAKSGAEKGSDYGYTGNHKRGIAAENKVNGTIRGKESYTPRGSTYSTTYYDKKGKSTKYSYSTKNPIIKVNKTFEE